MQISIAIAPEFYVFLFTINSAYGTAAFNLTGKTATNIQVLPATTQPNLGDNEKLSLAVARMSFLGRTSGQQGFAAPADVTKVIREQSRTHKAPLFCPERFTSSSR